MKKEKPNSHTPVPNLSGAHNYTGAPEVPVSPGAVILAQTAAPFAATGMDSARAISAAFSLLLDCDAYLRRLQSHEFFNHPLLKQDLDGVVKELSRNAKTVKSYLLEAVGEERMRELWRAAVRGEKVFSMEIVKAMRAVRDNRYSERGSGSAGNSGEN